MPDHTPTIRSGSSAAICSKLSSPDDNTSGSASPSSSCAQGHTPFGWSPNQSRRPTGTTPRASRKSCSLKPTDTTRCGSSSIVVEPNLCSIVTGNGAASSSMASTCVSADGSSLVPAAGETVEATALDGSVAEGSVPEESDPQLAKTTAAAANTAAVRRITTPPDRDDAHRGSRRTGADPRQRPVHRPNRRCTGATPRHNRQQPPGRRTRRGGGGIGHREKRSRAP